MMEWNEKLNGTFLICATVTCLLWVLGACGNADRKGTLALAHGKAEQSLIKSADDFRLPAKNESLDDADRETILQYIENIAELERSGVFAQGMGVRESVLRENLGDFAGAVAAVYKELAWLYSMGAITKTDVEQGLNNAIALGGETAQVAQGILAFVNGKWASAAEILEPAFAGTEPDSFTQWLLLCCTLEQNPADKQAAQSYRAIRARYEKFPEYWYRGAKVFSGSIAASYAEHCIGLAPDGPYAKECRTILGLYAGVSTADASSIRSRPEIESLITQAIAQGEPRLLDPLLPLIALPDNSYTVYAVGALRALAAAPKFRDYFSEIKSGARGRLQERLAYILRTEI